MNNRLDKQQGSIHFFMENTRLFLTPGSSGTIELGVTNLGDAEDVFAITITGLPEEYASLETPQVRLMPGEFRNVSLNIRLPAEAGMQSGQYPFEVLVASRNRPGEVLAAQGQLIIPAYSSEGRIGVLMPTIQFTVAPGSRVTTSMVLSNRGLGPDIFQLQVEGIPSGWISTPSAITRLDPGAQKEIQFSIQPPRASESLAGRHPFTIRVTSQETPDQATSIDCILTVTAYSAFKCDLQPVELAPGQRARVIVTNEGNVLETYSLTFQSPGDALLFEEVGGQVAGAGEDSQGAYEGASPSPSLRIPAGETGIFEFRTRLRSRPLIGRETSYPFVVQVVSSSRLTQTLHGKLFSKGFIPVWVFPVAAVLFLICLCGLILAINPLSDRESAATQTAIAATLQVAGATQTAAFNQTQAAMLGQEDTDGDGLVNLREIELGTDPANPDSDGDELLDGDEVNQRGTSPTNPDTDGDGLSDGDEILRRATDPLNPDTDQDGLPDGDEVQRTTDPLNPDSDGDALNDGEEVNRGTNPKNPDTDSDGLPDGRETPPCPDALNPDSDGDGIIDGRDIDPCDPNNPSLTATAGTLPPTQVTLTPTAPAATPTPPPLPSEATLAFESNREGNSEIYRLNFFDRSIARLTIDAATDTQPAWSPDGSRITFASNRSGNWEIFVLNADGTGLINVTNHSADDTDPVWSPDGSRIAFTSNRDGNNEIYAINADGNNPLNLTNNPAEDSQPAWFFQSTLLVLSEERIFFTSNRDGNQEVYSMLPDGTGQTNLTQHPANDFSPAGYRDASRMAFVSNRDGNQEIYLMNTDGSSPTNLSNNPAEDQQPAWLPTGEWLAFVTNRDGNQEIYLIKDDASSLINITQNPAGDFFPALYAR